MANGLFFDESFSNGIKNRIGRMYPTIPNALFASASDLSATGAGADGVDQISPLVSDFHHPQSYVVSILVLSRLTALTGTETP